MDSGSEASELEGGLYCADNHGKSVELVFRQPYCLIASVVDDGIAKRKTASEYLQELERIGILVSERRGREVIYRHPALIEVLTS